MTDYRVNLDIFAGPLDLLLYLVRKDEVDIYDIELSRITEQYIHHIEMLKSLDIDLAGDFLVMAATLMQIKSAMLLPKAEPDQAEDGDLIDPRTELIRQLLEYKKFKDAANLLAVAADRTKDRFSRPDTVIEKLKPETEPAVDIEQVSVWDLLEAFDSLMAATGATYDVAHITDDTPIDLYQIELLHRLQTEGPMFFEQMFETKTNRLVMVGLFLALLELIRETLVEIEQPKSSPNRLRLRSLTDVPAEQAVHKAILATETEIAGYAEQTPAKEEITPEAEIVAPADQNDQEQIITSETEITEPAEQTTPQASLAPEAQLADSPESVEAQQPQLPPIPIAELPPKAAPDTEKPLVTQQQRSAIPIIELPPEKDKIELEEPIVDQ